MAGSIVTQNSDGSYSVSHLNQQGERVNEPVSNIPGFEQLGLDPSSNSFHEYEVKSIVGNVNDFGMETAQDAFDSLTKTPAPFASSYSGFVSGDVAYVKGLGPVNFAVDSFNLNVTNITLNDQHLLYPGLVFQQAFVDASGNVGVDTIGLGNGPLRNINVDLSHDVFSFNSRRVQRGLQLAGLGLDGITGFQENQINGLFNPAFQAVPAVDAPPSLDPFNKLQDPNAFDPANPAGITSVPVISPQTYNPYDPFNTAGVSGALDPGNPTGSVPSQVPPSLGLPNYNPYDPFNAAGVSGAFDPANPGANPPGVPGEPADAQAPNAAQAPAPITAEYDGVRSSDPPGAAPANADPGQAAPTTSEYGGVAASDPPSDGQGGQTGYGGGQPAYGGYDPDPSNADPGDPGDPDGSGGIGREPIVLDLSGQGIALTQLTSSNQFEVGEDNYDHRTAWAGAGSAVLFVDPNGANAIVNADQYVFSDWDPSASSDMQALEDVFDTNHDGKLDAGDADFAKFKLMVTNADGTTSVETLAEAGITSIDLQANSVTQNFADGSSIDGETSFTEVAWQIRTLG